MTPYTILDDVTLLLLDNNTAGTTDPTSEPTSPCESETDEVYINFLQHVFLDTTTVLPTPHAAAPAILASEDELWSDIVNSAGDATMTPGGEVTAIRIDDDGLVIFDDESTDVGSMAHNEERGDNFAEFLDCLDREDGQLLSVSTPVVDVDRMEDAIYDRKDANFTAFLSHFNSQTQMRQLKVGVDNFDFLATLRKNEEDALWSEIVAGMTDTQKDELCYWWNIFSSREYLTEQQKIDLAKEQVEGFFMDSDGQVVEPPSWGAYLGYWFGMAYLTEQQQHMNMEKLEQVERGFVTDKVGQDVQPLSWGAYLGSWFGVASVQPVQVIQHDVLKVRRPVDHVVVQEDSFV